MLVQAKMPKDQAAALVRGDYRPFTITQRRVAAAISSATALTGRETAREHAREVYRRARALNLQARMARQQEN